jgi:tRNA threonylcarbamoyl adenosine modification protein YjeE
VAAVSTEISSEAEMVRLGERLGSRLRRGDVVLLDGPIGAGKSVLVRAALRSRGVTGNIPSPTFALAYEYDVDDDLTVVHADVYRLESAREYVDLALEESYDEPCLLIEWGSRFIDVMAPERLVVTIEPGASALERRVRLESVGDRWTPDLPALAGA